MKMYFQNRCRYSRKRETLSLLTKLDKIHQILQTLGCPCPRAKSPTGFVEGRRGACSRAPRCSGERKPKAAKTMVITDIAMIYEHQLTKIEGALLGRSFEGLRDGTASRKNTIILFVIRCS